MLGIRGEVSCSELLCKGKSLQYLLSDHIHQSLSLLQLKQKPELQINPDNNVYHYSEVVTLQCTIVSYPMPDTVTWSLCWDNDDTCQDHVSQVIVIDDSSYQTLVTTHIVLQTRNSSSVSVTCSGNNSLGSSTSHTVTYNIVDYRPAVLR